MTNTLQHVKNYLNKANNSVRKGVKNPVIFFAILFFGVLIAIYVILLSGIGFTHDEDIKLHDMDLGMSTKIDTTDIPIAIQVDVLVSQLENKQYMMNITSIPSHISRIQLDFVPTNSVHSRPDYSIYSYDIKQNQTNITFFLPTDGQWDVKMIGYDNNNTSYQINYQIKNQTNSKSQ